VRIKYDIDRICADKAQNTRRNLLERLDVEPVIAIRNNASTKVREYPLRREEILLIKKLGYQRWKQLKDLTKYSSSTEDGCSQFEPLVFRIFINF